MERSFTGLQGQAAGHLLSPVYSSDEDEEDGERSGTQTFPLID